MSLRVDILVFEVALLSMNTRSLFLSALLTAGLLLTPWVSGEDATNASPTNAVSPSVTVTPPPAPAPVPQEVIELKAELASLQRANEVVSEKWDKLMEQNSALSNVLTDLQTTLANEQKREAEISERARSFTMKILVGAAASVFLVFLASYWFQLRCLNRVMEFSRQAALQAPSHPHLLEAGNSRESQLLEAVKLLENRIQHLESPPNSAAASVAPSYAGAPETARTPAREPIVIDAGPGEPPPSSSKAAMLLAKGEILLDMERLQEAVATFQEALALDPANAEAHLKKGIALERMNRLELSLSSYDEALRLNPKRSFAYVHKARVLAALHRYDEALSVYDSALGKNAAKTSSGNLVNGY